jgi:toxic protein SymE
MAKRNIRRVKLHSKYREVRKNWQQGWYEPLPWLNVSGLWLEQAGFKAGDAVEITVAQNTLIIKNCSTDGDRDH